MDHKRTHLYHLHLELGAKMVPFAGYEMPLHYANGIIQEHKHTRNHAGFFDISHMGQFCISGENVAEQLTNLTPSNIARLQSGQQQYTVFTNESGGIIDDLIITRLDDKYFIIVNAACMEKDLQHLHKHLSETCHIEHLDQLCLFALQGPASAKIMDKLSATAAALSFMSACRTSIANIPAFVSRSGYTGEDGFEISIANEHASQLAEIILAENNVWPIGLGARDTLRLEAGLCLYGHELTETITPIEAKLHWIISNRSGNFPGADIISRQMQQPPDIIRVGIKPEGKAPVREETEILNGDNTVVGKITSGSFGPSAGHPIAMAQIQRQQLEADSPLFARVRNKEIPLAIAPLPFIPHRYFRK